MLILLGLKCTYLHSLGQAAAQENIPFKAGSIGLTIVSWLLYWPSLRSGQILPALN